MIKRVLSVIVLFLWTVSGGAQTISVLDVQPVTSPEEGGFYFPHFSPDDSKVLCTGETYHGLWVKDLTSGTLTQVSDRAGAGYEPVWSPNGETIYFRTRAQVKRRLQYHLHAYGVASGISNTVAGPVRSLSVPMRTPAGTVVAQQGDVLRTVDNRSLRKAVPNIKDRVVVAQNREMIVVEGTQKRTLTPMGRRHYIWPRLSPDGSKLLFTVAGVGTYISDLKGTVLVDLGTANAPRWSPDGRYVAYMKDRDDGYRITESEVMVATADGSYHMSLTRTEDRIELYPVWSHDGNKIAYHTSEGQIFVMMIDRTPNQESPE